MAAIPQTSPPTPPPLPPYLNLKQIKETDGYKIYESVVCSDKNIVHVKELKIRGGEEEDIAERIYEICRKCDSIYICRSYPKYPGKDGYYVYPSEGYTYTLHEYFKTGLPLRELSREFVQIFIDLARGLWDLHRMGMSHSNLQEEDSLVVINGRGKINGARGLNNDIQRDGEHFAKRIENLFGNELQLARAPSPLYQFGVLLKVIANWQSDSRFANMENHPIFHDKLQMMDAIASADFLGLAKCKSGGGDNKRPLRILAMRFDPNFGSWDWRNKIPTGALKLVYEHGMMNGITYTREVDSFAYFVRNSATHFRAKDMSLESIADWINDTYPEFTNILHFASVFSGVKIGLAGPYK